MGWGLKIKTRAKIGIVSACWSLFSVCVVVFCQHGNRNYSYKANVRASGYGMNEQLTIGAPWTRAQRGNRPYRDGRGFDSQWVRTGRPLSRVRSFGAE